MSDVRKKTPPRDSGNGNCLFSSFVWRSSADDFFSFLFFEKSGLATSETHFLATSPWTSPINRFASRYVIPAIRSFSWDFSMLEWFARPACFELHEWWWKTNIYSIWRTFILNVLWVNLFFYAWYYFTWAHGTFLDLKISIEFSLSLKVLKK